LVKGLAVPSTRSFFKGVEAWKEENRMHKVNLFDPSF